MLSLKLSRFPALLFTTLCLLAVVFFAYPTATTTAEQGGLEAAWDRAREAGSYDFTTDVEQTLIPRPIPEMIGQTDERVDMRIEGEVTLPDQVRMELRFEGGGLDVPPLALVRDGAETYLLKDGERVPVENPAGLASPTSDYLSYLAAAENVQPCEPADLPLADLRTCYSYDINGARFAEHVREQTEAQFAASEQPLPPGAELSPSPLLQRMTGQGQLWVDADGLPLRQVVDLELPQASEEYDAQVHIIVDFRFDEEARERIAVSQTSDVSENIRGLEVNLAPTDIYCTLFLLTAAGVLTLYRRRRWAYGLIAVSVSLILVISPLLQAAGVVRFRARQAQAAPAETVAEALGLPSEAAESAQPETQNTKPETRNPKPETSPTAPSDYEPDVMCGDGDPGADSDGDGLSDADENCLGTDPEHVDSDRDMITDTLELEGFSSGGRDWTGDAFNPDSNRDGLSDLAEWPEPVGAAPDMDDVSDDWDPDGDAIPNLWDADNDGDEVPDSIDLSPFARTTYSDSFSLTTQGSDFDGYQYIELQIQPEDMSHLRYSTTYLDWPYDERGQIQDLDDSTEDINLYPVLKVRTNQPPDDDLARTYGVSVFEDDGEYELYITPTPISDGGKIVAFYVKVAYGPEDLEDIRWEKVELLWMARMSMDQQVTDRYGNTSIETSVKPLHTYLEESFRVTGLQITKSRNFESMILGTPDSPDDDRWIFNLLFGLSNTFLTSQNPDLQELEFRFESPNTPLEKTWGVTSTLVTVDLPATPYGHVDEGLEELPARIQDFLEHNYPADSNPSLVIATQEEVGMYSLDDGENFEPGSSLNLNLADVALSTRRGLRSSTYESEDNVWDDLDLEETLELMDERYEGELADIVTDLEDEYPDLTIEDLELLLDMFYTAWFIGQTRILSLDGQKLAPDDRDDEEVFDELHQDVEPLPAYLLEAANLGEPGGGLRIGDSPTQYWEYQRDQEDSGIELGVVYPKWVVAGIIVGVILRTIFGLRTAVQAASFAGTMGFATRMKILSDNAGHGSRVLGVVGLVVSILAIWTIFFITAGLTGWDWDSPAVKKAAIFATVSTVITAILFAISLNPVGAICVGILAFIDLILFVVSLGEFSITTAIIEWITDLIYDAHVLTELEDVSFENFDTAVMDEEMGLIVGNRFRVSDSFVGTIWRTSYGENDDLEDSWVEADFHGSAGAADWANQNSGRDCDRSGSFLTCKNDVGVEFELDTAERNVKLTVESTIEAKTYYEECWCGDCERKSEYTDLPDDLPSYDQWDPMDFYLDVLPDNIHDLFNWSDIENPDPDGDGLTNDEEDSLGTDPDMWDSDGDGLADKFEVDSEETLGTDPTKADTDDDGLLDGIEYHLGTEINAADTDDDGLMDGEEVFHYEGGNWLGGWSVELPSGESAMVFSDPLVADADGDRLNDRSERNAAVSPFAYNDTAQLALDADPLAESPNGAVGVYVTPDEEVRLGLTLENTGPRSVTSTLTLCLPDFLTDVEYEPALEGDRTPDTITPATSCNGLEWSFAPEEDSLRPGEAVSTTITATVAALSSSASEEISATVTYMIGDTEEEIVDQAMVIVDVDDPELSITAPLSGTLLGGGINNYVIGGTSGDESSWVEVVEIDLPAGAGTVEAAGISPWAYTWELPDDGLYTLTARSYDYVGYTSPTATVVVTVDNTAPTVTLALEDGDVVTGTTGKVITLTLSGKAGDNLSGLKRVQVSTDGRPWREVPLTPTLSQGERAADWSAEWLLPSEESAQGEHVVKVRAHDRAGNESEILRRTIIVDVVPPTSELTDRTYLGDPPPYVQTGERIELYGVANDAGNIPEPARPVDLVGELDSIDNATIWLEMSSVDDDDSGVSVAWLGDFNGDRLSDLVVGLPAAGGGDEGRVTIVYGSAGGWPTPTDAELLADSTSSLVGEAGAGVGDVIGPAGDVDGDGFSDLLVGDSENDRVYVIFGRAGPLGRDLVLEGPRYPYWTVVDLKGLGDLTGLSAAGDVNGDGFDDLLIGTSTGTSSRCYLLLGHAAPWWETVPLDERAATEIDSGANSAFLSSAGDMDGDEYDEFVVAEGNQVYLFEGRTVFEETLALSDAIATFDSSELRPQVAALGDVNGDGLADFIYADGDTPQVVFGDADRDWTTQALDLTPAPSGFLAAPGDVDYDGLADLLVQNAEGDAYLILGKELADSEVKAILTEVQAAASAPYAAGADGSAGADLNSDGSSDLLLVPSVLGGAGASVMNYGPLPHIDPSDLPKAETGFFSKRSDKNPVSSSPLRPVVNYTVDDDGDADFTTIQAAVDAAGDGDRIYVDPGVYGSFTVTGKDDLYIAGTNTDAVFVDGDGGDFAVKIQDADGVDLKRLTLRNADNGVVLENAGVEGYEDEEKNILLERVLIHDFDSHAVAMDRVSTARLTRCTLAGQGDHIDLYGAADPAMDESWNEDSTDWRTATSADGGMFGDGSKLYFVDSSAEVEVYTPDTASWSTLPDPPLGDHAGATLDENGSLWVLRRDLDTGFDGPIHAIVYVSEDEVYVGGDFTHAGDVAVNYIARWNGSEFTAVGEGLDPPDDTVYDIKLDGRELYAGGAFGLRYLPDKDDPHSIWENWGDISGDGAVYALAVDSSHNSVYAGGSFDDIGGLSSAHKIARRKSGSWEYLGLQKQDANGIDGSHVSALALKDDYVYLGGEFSGWGGTSYGDIHNLARIWRSSGYITVEPNDYDLNPGSAIYALEVVGDNIIVGGDFRNVMCFYDDTRPWCSASGDADNLVILKPDGDWWLPDYLKADDPVRTMERDGDDLYIGGDFTQVGDSTAADHVAHYDYVEEEWEALDGGVNDTVYAVAAGDGDRAYVGGDFFQADGQAAFHLARWDGSGWTWRSEQSFYEYDGSWHKRSDLPLFVGDGSAIVESSAADGGDGELYAIPASGSRALYRYTIDSDDWETRADLPEGAGVGGALAWADGYLYALRGGTSDDFYRYDPDADEWSTLAALPSPRVADAGASLAWDGRNWLYAWIGGNGRQFLRYCIDEDRWEELDDAPAEVNAGGGLARIGQNLYGVPGGDEVLWSYDPIAVYPEKLTLDRVAFVAPETVDAAAWINLDSVIVPPDDFVVTGTDNTWVGRSGFAWSPEPLLDDSVQLAHDDARFLDVERDVYRVGSGTLLDGGYHTYRSDYTVEPCEGVECTSPNPIQAGVNSGANRVLLEPGVYDKGFYLISGVEVIGDGADLTIVEPQENDTAIVRAEGVVGARLSMLTLHGVDGSVDGLYLEDGTQAVVIDHAIIRGTNTGISTTGEATELEVVNNTIVSNTNGLVAADCAPVDVRNTIFAHHSDTGLTYDGCAARKLHNYNLYWENGTNISSGNPGAAELFLDPLFVDPGPPAHDYHTENGSPVIDAGDPGDPPPPGAGARVDIGYIDQNRAGLYVNGEYCETCVNDGLSWQVDAFDKIQDALDKADGNLRELEGWRYTVAVAAGTYTETLTVPSYVRLVGDGAEESTINADGAGVAVTVDGVAQFEINGFTIKGCTDTAAISVTGASNAVTITRNIIENCNVGVSFDERASGLVTFNTVVGSEKSVVSSGAGSWATVENNILYSNYSCEGGLWTEGDGQIFSDYNLRECEGEIAVCFNVDKGPNDICGDNPRFESGSYRIQADSPARDAASPFVEPPAGGGERADMGYYELVADPITLFLGREDVSSATGNSGLSEVEVGFSAVSDPDDAVTDTLPSTWTTVTLETPGETVSYWQVAFTPTQESLYRFYSRATDVVDNQECEGASSCSLWYDGAFVADSVPPVVTWTQPSPASVTSPLELRAEVYDYAADEFSVDDMYFVVDGDEYEAEWAADPWDEGAQEPRTFRAWVSLDNGTYDNAEAVAEDRAGNVMSDTISFEVSGSTGADTISPTLDVISPTDGSWYTGTVVFSGTVEDADSGVAVVEISLDGGYTWQPVTVDTGFAPARWSLTWEAPDSQEFVSYPTQVRARDQAGNSTAVSLTFSIDNVPPIGPHVEEFLATLGGLFEQDAPPGTHFDMPVSLKITWRKPTDGSGEVETLIAVDQVTDTVPTVATTGVTNTTRYLASGDRYVHLGVRDKLGNQFTRHYGPWHVGKFADLKNSVQTIIVDGEIDIGGAEDTFSQLEDIYDQTGWEWVGYEYIDDFEHIYEGGLTLEEALDWWGRQRLFTTWDGANVYLGWMGAWWELDGTLWIYLSTEDSGCEDAVVPPVVSEVEPLSDTLPFEAEYAVAITSPNSGTLWACDGSDWQEDTGTDWEFAQGDSGDTEIRLGLDVFSITDLGLLAFALDDDGQPWSVFPTNNPLFGDWDELYNWRPGDTITPTLNQPKGTSLLMELDSLQAPQGAWCPDSALQYVTELKNQELYTIPAGLPLVFDVGPGLDFQGMEGALLDGDWQFELPAMSPGAELPITITGQLTSDVCSLVGSRAMSVNVSLPVIGDWAKLDLSHRLDCDPPTVTVSTDPTEAIRPVLGFADDGYGSGLTLVEYRINSGAWQPVSGTLFWSADMELPAATTWDVSVRAQDRCGRYSEVETVAFSDTVSPTVTLETLRLERPADLEGTASDLPSGGEVISVEVRIDEETAAWQPASFSVPDGDGVQDWQFAWASQWDSVTHTVWVRAADVAGNVGQYGPFQVYVYVAEGEAVGGYTEVTLSRTWMWLLVALVIVGIGAATVLEKRRRAL